MKFAFRILPAMICLIGILYAAPKTAHACTNPTGVAGDSMFNETSNVPAYCDGTDWIAMSGGEFCGWSDLTSALGVAPAGVATIASNGSTLITGNNSPISLEVSSDDGATWSDNYAALSFTGSSIFASHFDGTNFIVAGGSGHIAFSSDASTWTNRRVEGGFTTNIQTLTSNGGLVVAAGNDGAIKTTSDDGATWTDRTTAAGFGGAAIINSVTYHNSLLVAASGGGSGGLRTSVDDGATWVDRTVAADFAVSINSLASNGTILVAGGRGAGGIGTLKTSADNGATWTDRSTQLNFGSETVTDVFFWDGLLIAGANNGLIKVSSDNGATWTSWQAGLSFGTEDIGSFGTHNSALYVGGTNGLLKRLPSAECAPTTVVPSGLVGHWRLDETSGTFADSSGNGNDGSQNGGVTYAQDGVIDEAASFDGTDDYISIPDDATLSPASDFTISAWFNVNNENASFGAHKIIAKDDPVDGRSWYEMDVNEPEKSLRCSFRDTGGTVRVAESPSDALEYGKWYHGTCILNSSDNTLKAYINGVEVDSEAAPNPPNVTANPVVIGRQNATGFEEYMDGSIDDVRIYDRALTEDEVLKIYQAKDGIRYNDAQRTMQFFDGNRWVSMTPDWADVDQGPVFTTQDAAAMGCSTIGQVCSDGTVYAGLSTDGSVEMFTTPNDQTTTPGVTWGPTSDTTGYTDVNTGAAHQADAETNLTLSNYPAFELCANLSFGSQNDWYLPAIDELNVLYTNHVAIGNFVTTPATAQDTAYWSSTDPSGNNSFAAGILFYNGDYRTGNQTAVGKTQNNHVRCVRKGPSSEITGSGGLIGHWKFDETSGTTVFDSSGLGSDGVMQNTLTADSASRPAPVGKGLEFIRKENEEDIVFIDLVPAAEGFTQYTTSFWFKSNDTSVGGGRIFEGDGTNNLKAWVFTDELRIGYLYALGQSRDWETTSLNIQNDTWYHVVITDDFSEPGTAPILYVNGSTVSVSQFAGDTTSVAANDIDDIRIGNRVSPEDRALNGVIDDFRLYDREITAAEVTKLYQMGAPIGTSTSLPQGCPTIGDVCDDGTIYVGNSPDGTIPMFTAAQDHSDLINWNFGNVSGRTNPGATNADTGEANTNTLVIEDADSDVAGFQTHRAAQLCYDLNESGASDWYLPAENEALLLWENLVDQDGDDTPGGPLGDPYNFAVDRYWTSTENATNTAFSVRMDTDGSINGNNKYLSYHVRCVRKGPAPRCANPYGMEGDVFYNTTHNVLQFCDGARWLAIGKVN